MQRIYLDANATTPVLPEVVEAMRPFWLESFGNPSSAHQPGQRTRSAVEHARGAMAKLLNCTSKELIFTSGGTESDNLALSAALKPHTKLVSIMLANNETGAIQPVGKLARIAKAHGTLVHTDAVQAAAKLPLDLSGEFKNVDLLSLSGHKMYAPQGTGVLFVRKGVPLAPLFHGGPHERQRRAGTENVPGIVALGRAAELAHQWLNSQLDPRSSILDPNPMNLSTLRDRLEQGLLNAIPNAWINA